MVSRSRRGYVGVGDGVALVLFARLLPVLSYLPGMWE